MGSDECRKDMPFAASRAIRLRSGQESGSAGSCNRSNRLPREQNSVTMLSGDTTTPINSTAQGQTNNAFLSQSNSKDQLMSSESMITRTVA